MSAHDTASAVPAARDLTDIGTLRRLLAAHGMQPNTGLGQHLLVSRQALDALIAAASLAPADSTLEVGAGAGVLTIELARHVRRVVAVELDRAILPVLRATTAPYPNVTIVAGNLLDIVPADVFRDEPYKLVANLPYYITALTLRHFLDTPHPPELIVIMVQREVAERIVATPGHLSLLGVSVQFFGSPQIVATVPPSAFYPPPRVESAIVRVAINAPPLSGIARERFFGIVHAGFAERRKQLHNSLERNLRQPPERIVQWLAAADIQPARRAQTLSLDEWLRLARVAEDLPEPSGSPSPVDGTPR